MVEILLAVTIVCVASLTMHVLSLTQQIYRYGKRLRALEERIELLHKQLLRVESCDYLKEERDDS